MTKVVVTGMGLVSSLGSMDVTWRRLLLGKSGIGIYQPFPELPPQPLALVNHQPSHIEVLLRQALSEALEDASLTTPMIDSGVVIGSSRGFQGQWEAQACKGHDGAESHAKDDPSWISSVNIAHIYGVSPATVVAESLASQGPILAPRAACATGIWAIAQGAELIRDGYCSRVVVGAVEAPVTPLTLSGFKKMGAMATSGAYPFDLRGKVLFWGKVQPF